MKYFAEKVNILRWIVFTLIFSIPFGTKKFIFLFNHPFSNYYTSEYNTAFVFGVDILLIIFLIVFFLTGKRIDIVRERLFQIFLFFSAISVFIASYKLLSLYSLSKLLLAVFFSLALAVVIRDGTVKIREILCFLAGSAVFQAIVSFFQFFRQGSVGLKFLGETVIRPSTTGVAKTAIGGVNFLRVYGTMPHPNILAAFLVIGLLSLFYFFIEGPGVNILRKSAVVFGIFSVIVALVLTFSRSGWIAGVIAGFVTVFWSIFSRKYRVNGAKLLVILGLITLVIVSVLGWLIFPRAGLSSDEGPVVDRMMYNYIGLGIMAHNFFGVGLGNEIFYAFDAGIFKSWGMVTAGRWQAVHNIYVLIASEIGIIGALALFAFVGKLALKNIKKMNLEIFTVQALLLVILALGLVDHYYWDLENGRLMFWLVIGLMMGLGPHSSMDRAQASEA
jgi:O-antigen ligase